ncbi:MAG: 16S rRNA (guanine(527)-N(7))-methyltransferase RsmG, partial [Atopobiaceae bacterium]|nr:16S rRNA (guanine(527)-N(7))-methyltransferase RsmG [Atopobiaceae bacterium]
MDTMLDTSSLAAQLREEAQTIGVQVSDDQAALMVKHLGLVIEKNKVVNLTRIVDEHDAVTK